MNFLDLIFPKGCLECGLSAQAGRSGRYICETCLAKVGRGRTSRYSISLFKYEGVIRKAIIALKYKFAFGIAKELAEVCARRIRERGLSLENAILVPIPLHKMRQNWRGFNQAEIAGKLIAENMAWQFTPDLLIRKVSNKPQVGLKGPARHQNVKNIFEVNSSVRRLVPSACTLLVFDDVYTTGSTIREAIKVLKKLGFQRVFGLTIAS